MDTEAYRKILQESYGITGAHSMGVLPGGTINTNVLVRADQGGFVFRIHELASPQDVGFEIAVLEYLREVGFPSPRVVLTVDGNPFVLLGDKPTAVFRYIEGTTLEEVTPETIYNVGVLAGRLHRLLVDFPCDVFKQCWEPEDISRYMREGGGVVRSRPMPGISATFDFIVSEFERMEFPDGLPQGVTHQDIKPANVVVSKDGSLSLIDFDSMYRATLLYDMLTTAIWMCFPDRKFDATLFQNLLVGYASERPLTDAEKEFMFDALRFRMLREAFVWPFRWLDPEKAAYQGAFFVDAYKDMLLNEDSIKELAWKN